MTTRYSLNEVDLEAVSALVTSIQTDPAKAQTSWQSEALWDGAFRVETRSRDFAPVAYDEPPSLGGTNTAPNPVEHLLGALGSCLVIGYAANATVAGITIHNLKIDLEGDLDLHTFLGLGDGNAGFKDVRAQVHIESDATPEQLEALHRQVVSTSPVGHTLSRPIAVSVDLAN